MTETTQETIKFARSWLENAEKYGDPNAPTTGTMTALAHAVVELSAELAALKEKYRWRKQSEEPTPGGGAEALIQVGRDYVITHAVVFNDDTAYEKVTGRRIYLEYWRPLDLPEESK